MKIETEVPFQDYRAYTWFNPRKGRWIVQLCHLSTGKRTSMTYARYLVCVKEGRMLCPVQEHVDHVNETKADDRLDNLQILTPQENTRKRFAASGISKKMADLVCPVCAVGFSRPANRVEWKLKIGRIPACGKRCGGIMSIRNGVRREATGLLRGRFCATQ